MTPDITLGDGQACLFYGQSLVAMGGELIIEDDPDLRRLLPGEDPQEPAILMLASRVFLRGCVDDQPEACRPHDTSFSNWSAGRYPRQTIPCQVIDATGQAGRVQNCKSNNFAHPAAAAAEHRNATAVYIWPDGNRTLVCDDVSIPQLNGMGPRIRAQEIRINGATRRQFCTAPSEVQ